MAAHVREQIAAACVTALTGLGTTAGNVFRDRDTEGNPLQSDELPGLVIVDDGDSAEVLTLGISRILERKMTLRIDAHVKTDGGGAMLDQILKEIEAALGAPGVPLGGAKAANLAEVAAREASESTELPTLRQGFTFQLVYYTAHDAPDIAF